MNDVSVLSERTSYASLNNFMTILYVFPLPQYSSLVRSVYLSTAEVKLNCLRRNCAVTIAKKICPLENNLISLFNAAGFRTWICRDNLRPDWNNLKQLKPYQKVNQNLHNRAFAQFKQLTVTEFAHFNYLHIVFFIREWNDKEVKWMEKLNRHLGKSET